MLTEPANMSRLDLLAEKGALRPSIPQKVDAPGSRRLMVLGRVDMKALRVKYDACLVEVGGSSSSARPRGGAIL